MPEKETLTRRYQHPVFDYLDYLFHQKTQRWNITVAAVNELGLCPLSEMEKLVMKDGSYVLKFKHEGRDYQMLVASCAVFDKTEGATNPRTAKAEELTALISAQVEQFTSQLNR